MMDDNELLRHYARTRSQDAFTQLVKRHVDLVYSAALRQTGGDHLRAQEVTQMVFSDLARKAASLAGHPLLPAWLHRSTRLSALRLARSEARRRHYERAAGREAALLADDPESLAWDRVRPVLDEAIDELPETDRRAVVLRYFSNSAFGEVGRQLGLSENAARMRVDRALDKLRDRLETKGIASSSAALATALTSNAILAAPPGAALAAVNASALAGTGATAGSLIGFMSLSKLPVTLTAAALVCGTGVLALQERTLAHLDKKLAENAEMSASIANLEASNRRLRADAVAGNTLEATAASLPQLRAYAAALREHAAKKPARTPTTNLQIEGNVPALNISQLDQVPRPTFQVRPMYPPEMKKMGVSGKVLVDFLVGTDGKVYNVYPVSSAIDDGTGAPDSGQPAASSEAGQSSLGNSAVHLQSFVVQHDGSQSSGADVSNATGPSSQFGASDFAASAVQAVSQWQFKPGQKQGEPVYTHMQVPIVFSLSEAPTASTWF